jgi:CheY-like chemotaxis protein
LISNAAKFTARGVIELDAGRAGSEIVISVRDSGVGIDTADLTRIFAPFYRGHAPALTLVRGMGLGLAIAQEIATLLGGRIEVESAVGRGSTFRLLLPVDATARANPPQGQPGLPNTVILIVEDDDDCRVRAADALRLGGARVIEAGNGFEGLKKAREHHPDVIVLDLGLPGLSGVDMLAQLRHDRQFAAVPVVITTADPEPEARCHEIGCSAYMLKPYAPDELVSVIAPLVRRTAPRLVHAG